MLFSRSTIASALVGFAAAQSSLMASEAMASSTVAAAGSLSTATLASTGGEVPAGMVKTHLVQVGGPNGKLAFYPNNVVAAPGDLVQFQFHPKNHSVVQATFDNPCVPITNIMPNKTDAFFSGFMPTNASLGATSNVLTYTIRVSDAKPVWFYCSQGMHCQAGMVGAINAPASGNKTIQAFTALAAQAPANLSPGQGSGSGSGAAGGNAGGAGSAGGAGGGSAAGTGSVGGAAGNVPPTPTASAPAQNTANVAPALKGQSLFGLGAAVAAAFAML